MRSTVTAMLLLTAVGLVGCNRNNQYKDPAGSNLPDGYTETAGRCVNVVVEGDTEVFEMRSCVDRDGEVWGMVPSDSYPDGHAPATEQWTWRPLPTAITQGNITTGDDTLSWMNDADWGFIDGQVDRAKLSQGIISVIVPGADRCTQALVRVIN